MRQIILASTALVMGLSVAGYAQTTPARPDTSVAAPHATVVERSTDKSVRMNASPAAAGTFATIPSGEELSSKVVGLDIYNNANKDIGKIKDIAFDQGGVKAYIVAVGGFLGMGDRYVAINPSAVDITYDASAKKWHAAMNTDAEQLKAAPEYKYSSND